MTASAAPSPPGATSKDVADRLAVWLPVIAAVVVVGAAVALTHYSAIGSPRLTPGWPPGLGGHAAGTSDVVRRAIAANELVAWITWLISAVLLVVMQLAGVVIGGVVIWLACHDGGLRDWRARAAAVLLTAIVGAGLCLSPAVGNVAGFTDRPPIEAFRNQDGAKALDAMTPWLNRATAVAVAFIIGAACATLLQLGTGQTADAVSRQTDRLRVVLYVGAALLAAGVLEIGALMNVPLALLPPTGAPTTSAAQSGGALGTLISPPSPPDVIALKQIGTTWAHAVGGFFTILLASIYAPAAFVLACRNRRLGVTSASPAPGVETLWGLDRFGRVMTVLTPLLTSWAGTSVFGFLRAP